MVMTKLEKEKSFIKELDAEHARFMYELDKYGKYDTIIFTVLGALVVAVFVAVIVIAIINSCTKNVWYEYVDTNGQRGQASYCSTTKGNMTCRINDNKVIKVQEYEKFVEPK